MYPLRRQILESLRARKLPPLAPGETHVNHMRAWPWDIDPFGDLNNGRIVTLSDVGRIVLAQRSGMIAALRRRKWAFAMAGSTPQYRKRATMWNRLEFHSRLIGRDERFFFIEHTMLANDVPAAHIMCKSVIIAGGKIAPTQMVAEEMGVTDWNPPVPEWVRDWADADARRPWPPDTGGA